MRPKKKKVPVTLIIEIFKYVHILIYSYPHNMYIITSLYLQGIDPCTPADNEVCGVQVSHIKWLGICR